MLLLDGPLTFREFMTHEDVPLASLFREVFLFLAGRTDLALFGAQAVNAYCEPERMTQDVDLLSTDASGLAEALRAHLATHFHLALRIREPALGIGFRVYQLRQPKNRHLVDIRYVPELPDTNEIHGVAVVTPPELIAMKIISLAQRRGRPKGGTDLVDVQRLLLTFPTLKHAEGLVAAKLQRLGASDTARALWVDVAHAPLEDDEDEGY